MIELQSKDGDLGTFIADELARRRIRFPKTNQGAGMAASWQVETLEVGSELKALMLRASGCSFPAVCRFCLSLLAGLRDSAPLTEEEDFSFSLPEGSGHFFRRGAQLIVLFHKRRTAFTISGGEQGVQIVFFDRA